METQHRVDIPPWSMFVFSVDFRKSAENSVRLWSASLHGRSEHRKIIISESPFCKFGIGQITLDDYLQAFTRNCFPGWFIIRTKAQGYKNSEQSNIQRLHKSYGYELMAFFGGRRVWGIGTWSFGQRLARSHAISTFSTYVHLNPVSHHISHVPRKNAVLSL